MDTFDCRHCLYSASNRLLLGRHNVRYQKRSCIHKYGARARGAGDALADPEEPRFEDVYSDEDPFDYAASDSEDEDVFDQAEQDDLGPDPPVIDDDSPPDRPFDTNMELVLLLDRLVVSRALQQDVLDFLFHPEFDLSEVLPKSGTAASRHFNVIETF